MTPGSGTETDARSDASITAQAARAKELRLVLAVVVFQRSLTRCRWLLDPLPLELTSQVETDQPLLSCTSTPTRLQPTSTHRLFLLVRAVVAKSALTRCQPDPGSSSEVEGMSEVSRTELAPQPCCARRPGGAASRSSTQPSCRGWSRWPAGSVRPHLAEDVAQEAMLVAYRRWRELDDLERPDLWVRRTCANLAVSQFRRRLVEMPGRRPARRGRRQSPVELTEAGEAFWTAVRTPAATAGAGRGPAVRLRHVHGRHRRRRSAAPRAPSSST